MAARRALLRNLGPKKLNSRFIPDHGDCGGQGKPAAVRQLHRLCPKVLPATNDTCIHIRDGKSTVVSDIRNKMSTSAAPTLNPEALTGFADGASYDAHRPSYPVAAVEKLVRAVGIAGRAKARVLDLAAGTGKFTELLAARPEGFEVVAVEPHDDMRRELQRKALPNVEVKKGFATSIPLEDASVDAIICAQAFHWFATGPALAEMARVLRPRARLGLVWNIEDYNQALAYPSRPRWAAALRDELFVLDRRHALAETRFRHDRWRSVFAAAAAAAAAAAPPHHQALEQQRAPGQHREGDPCEGGAALFGPLQEARVDWAPLYLPKDELWRRVLTLSCVGVLEGAERARVEKLFGDAVDAEATERDEAGRIPVFGITVLAWAEKV